MYTTSGENTCDVCVCVCFVCSSLGPAGGLLQGSGRRYGSAVASAAARQDVSNTGCYELGGPRRGPCRQGENWGTLNTGTKNTGSG